MKAILLSALLFLCLIAPLHAKTICGSTVDNVGVLTFDEKRPDVAYRPNYFGIAAGILFAPTIVVPAYVIGFSLIEPRGANTPCNVGVRR